MELKQMSWPTFVRLPLSRRLFQPTPTLDQPLWRPPYPLPVRRIGTYVHISHFIPLDGAENYAAVRQAKIGQATRNLCQCAHPAPAHTENSL